MKNVDKIRQMNSAELAELLSWVECSNCVAHKLCSENNCSNCSENIQQWLEQEIEE